MEQAILDNPDAKAIMVNNPTYYGICSDLKKITELAHAHGMLVLVDEAHGTHFYFGENFPVTAMAAGADCASVSMHKSGGSLTQSSFLLMGKNINSDYMRLPMMKMEKRDVLEKAMKEFGLKFEVKA